MAQQPLPFTNPDHSRPHEEADDSWTFGELRALAALAVFRHGADLADVEGTDPALRALAPGDWPEHPSLTDAELGWVRVYMRRAVVKIDGRAYGAEV